MSLGECNQETPVLPKRIWRGIREALDGGRGRLRMDPQDLANLIGAAIDREVERLERIREMRARRSPDDVLRLQADRYFQSVGCRRPATPLARSQTDALFENEDRT
jgi:hypothetical protein